MHQAVSFNIGALARRTGIPGETLRARERRYGVPMPGRTPAGHRRYSETDLATVIRMRQLLAEGLAPSVAARNAHTANPSSHSPGASGRLAHGYAERLVSASAAYDEARADAILSDAFLVYPIEDVCMDVISHALSVLVSFGGGASYPWPPSISPASHRDRLATLRRWFACIESARLA